MSQNLVKILGGSLGGHGKINSDKVNSYTPVLGNSCGNATSGVCVGKGAVVNPGDPQTLTINGSLILDAGALIFTIAGTGPGESDFLDIIGNAFFVDTVPIKFDFINGFLPQTGDLFNFMNVSDGVDVSNFLGFNFLYEGIGPGFETTLLFDPEIGSFTLRADNDASPVPEPSTLSLMMIALFGIGVVCRRVGLVA